MWMDIRDLSYFIPRLLGFAQFYPKADAFGALGTVLKVTAKFA